MTATITTTDLAAELGTDPRTLRKFLRADAKAREVATPGKGSRYALKGDARSIAAMQKKFTKWTNAQNAAKAAKATESDTED